MKPSISNGSTASLGGFKNSNLVQAWLVLLLALCFGGALAAVQVNLSSVIAANKLNETLGKVPELVWGAQTGDKKSPADTSVVISPGTVTVQKSGKTSVYPLYRISRDERLAGWVIKAGGQGYAGKIELLLGLDSQAQKITGLFILEQKETPGLGNKISFADWRNQFIGKQSHPPLEVIKGKGQGTGGQSIDAVTGATISSRAVTGIVNTTLTDIQGRLTPEFIHIPERQP